MPAALALALLLAPPEAPGEPAGGGPAFVDWAGVPDRVWAGPDLWANRLQDWRVRGGKLECVEGRVAKPRRTVVHTGLRLAAAGSFDTSVLIGPAGGPAGGAAGVLVGAGPDVDPRAAALVHHAAGPGAGYFCGVTADGRLFVRDLADPDAAPAFDDEPLPGAGPVRLTVARTADGRLNVGGERGESSAFFSTDPLPADRLRGSVGLVSHPGTAGRTRGGGRGGGRWAFSEWRLAGDALEPTGEDCRLGPILGAKYTLDAGSPGNGADGTGLLTLQAQFWPLRWAAGGREDYAMTATLELDRGDGFKTAAAAPITRPDWTAVFRLENFDATADAAYRVVYRLKTGGGSGRYEWPGVVRADPAGGKVVLAALSCNNNNRGPLDRPRYSFTDDRLWFPHAPIRDAVLKADPDVCYFAGDQIYEGNSPTAPRPHRRRPGQLPRLSLQMETCGSGPTAT